MKKFTGGAVVGAILTSSVAFALSYAAEPATFKVMMNGKEFNSDPPALVVEGRTYLPLRAVGDALGVPVEWNSELNQAEIGTSINYNAYDVSNYIIGTVWNDGFWWIRNYVDGSYNLYDDMYKQTFASSYDEDFDIEKIVNSILKTKQTMEYYNNIFNLNSKWDDFYREYNRLYEIVKAHSFTEDNFDTTYFTKVRDEFCNSLV